jgi:transcription elongation factor GreA
MENNEVYMTPEGITKLRDELDRLKNERRPALAERLHHAIQQGDLSENADYQTRVLWKDASRNWSQCCSTLL